MCQNDQHTVFKTLRTVVFFHNKLPTIMYILQYNLKQPDTKLSHNFVAYNNKNLYVTI